MTGCVFLFVFFCLVCEVGDTLDMGEMSRTGGRERKTVGGGTRQSGTWWRYYGFRATDPSGHMDTMSSTPVTRWKVPR